MYIQYSLQPTDSRKLPQLEYLPLHYTCLCGAINMQEYFLLMVLCMGINPRKTCDMSLIICQQFPSKEQKMLFVFVFVWREEVTWTPQAIWKHHKESNLKKKPGLSEKNSTRTLCFISICIHYQTGIPSLYHRETEHDYYHSFTIHS